MKFAALALLGLVSTMQISTEEGVDLEIENQENILEEAEEDAEENVSAPCISKGDSDDLFDLANTEHKKHLAPREIYRGMKQWAFTTGNCVDKKKSQWIMKNAHTLSVQKNHDKAKFWKFNQGFANTFKLTCKKVAFCYKKPLATRVFKEIAHGKPEMTKAELMRAVEITMHYEKRKMDKHNMDWVNEAMDKDAANGGNKETLSFHEFWVFGNQFFHYFKIPCPK